MGLVDKKEWTSKRVALIYSGGLDSTVLLYQILAQHPLEVVCLTFDYGQRHLKETDAAKAVVRNLQTHPLTRDGLLHYQPIALPSFIMSKGALTGGEPVPHGHYEEDSMKATVVPNRNMIMLSIAIGYAISKELRHVAYAAHSGDHAVYPDCRPEFIGVMMAAARLCSWEPMQLHAPFMTKTKADIVRLGAELEVPFQLTWSCYEGGDQHCGKCGTCSERKEAFSLAGVSDPTPYAS